MNADRQQAIELKLRKAKALLSEANVLFENKFYATANSLFLSINKS